MSKTRKQKINNELKSLIIKAIENLPQKAFDVFWEKVENELLQNELPQKPKFSDTISLEVKPFPENELINTLKLLGIPASINGYTYLKVAITYYAVYKKNNGIGCSLHSELYPYVAYKLDTTVNRVERAIRHAIETGWERGNLELLDHIFGYTTSDRRGKATNSEFIAMIAEYLVKK